MNKLFLVGFLIALAFESSAQGELEPTEFQPVVAHHLIGGSTLQDDAQLFKTVFRRSAAPKDFKDYEYELTTREALLKLTQNTSPTNWPNGQADSFYRVLRIFYGYDALNKKLKLIYLPDFAIKKNADEANLFIFEKGSPDALLPDTKVWMINDQTHLPSKFDWGDVEATVSPRKYFNDYRSAQLKLLEVNRYGIPNPTSSSWEQLNYCPTFCDGMDYDAQGVTFSFFEIESLFPPGNVYIVHLPERKKISNGWTFKHGLAFSVINPADANDDNTAADVGSLCPTVCGKVRLHWIGKMGVGGFESFGLGTFQYGFYQLNVIRKTLNLSQPALKLKHKQ